MLVLVPLLVLVLGALVFLPSSFLVGRLLGPIYLSIYPLRLHPPFLRSCRGLGV